VTTPCALADFEAALELDPKNVAATVGRGSTYAKRAYEKSRSDYEAAAN
jgi:hypothetical protein